MAETLWNLVCGDKVFRKYDRPPIRTLRAVYNVAIEEKCVKADDYPFKSYKVSKLHQATAKRAISKADIMRIIEYRSNV